METKTCSLCNLKQDIFNFYIRSKKNGIIKYRNECKNCFSQRGKIQYQNNNDIAKINSKKYYKNNQERVLKKQKKYREIHKEEISEYFKLYYEENKDKLSFYQKEYYNENKEHINERQKKYNIEHRKEINKRQNLYIKNQYLNNPVFRLRVIISVMIRNQLKLSNI